MNKFDNANIYPQQKSQVTRSLQLVSYSSKVNNIILLFQLLHSLEDDSSLGRNSPDPALSKAQQPKQSIDANIPNATSQGKVGSKKTSPRTATSPATSSPYSVHDVNGIKVKKTSLIDDGVLHGLDIGKGDEEESLLSKKW